MAFIRVKKVKGIPYAKVVKNVWRKRKQQSRQKTVKHLGKVITLTKKKLSNDQKLKGTDFQEIVYTAISNELKQHGFKQQKNVLQKENIIADVKKKKFYDQTTEKNVVLKLNEGLLCNYTMRKLLRFKPEYEEGKEAGWMLSLLFLKTGLNREDKDVFVEIYKKSIESSMMTLEQFKDKYL